MVLYIQLADRGAVSHRRHLSEKYCSKVHTPLPHSPVLPSNKKLFRAGGVKGRRLAGTEKQAVCCLIYSFVMHIKFDNRSSALPYNWTEKRKCFAIRGVQAEATGEYMGQSPSLRKVQHLTRRCPLPKQRFLRQSVLLGKPPFCGFSFPNTSGKRKTGMLPKAVPFVAT